MTYPLPADHRYTDRDVRENQYLYYVAVEYLHSYGGDFEFLVRAKRSLEAIGSLPVATIRGVLNCMRSDPSAAINLPSPKPPRLKVVTIQRPARIRLKATFHKQYLTSTWPTARLSHWLDPVRTVLWWHPHTASYSWDPYPLCSMHFGRAPLLNTHYVPLDKKECQRCVDAAWDRGIKYCE